MTQARSMLLAIATAVSWGIAALYVGLQLEKGVEWNELNLVFPICFGGLGFIFLLGPFFGWFHDNDAHGTEQADADGHDNDNETSGSSSDGPDAD